MEYIIYAHTAIDSVDDGESLSNREIGRSN